jgi:hypothetical protein
MAPDVAAVHRRFHGDAMEEKSGLVGVEHETTGGCRLVGQQQCGGDLAGENLEAAKTARAEDLVEDETCRSGEKRRDHGDGVELSWIETVVGER